MKKNDEFLGYCSTVLHRLQCCALYKFVLNVCFFKFIIIFLFGGQGSGQLNIASLCFVVGFTLYE